MKGLAVEALRAGEPVVLPTDTVYGLCADARREDAVTRLSQLKGRDAATPIALIATDVDAVLAAVPELAGGTERLLRALLPGAFTVVVPNPARRLPWLGGARADTIGLRIPHLPEPTRAVVEAFGPIAATSANRHGERDPRRLDDVPEEIRAACGAVVDGGELPGAPSTVVDVTGAEPRVLREGAVPAAEALARIRDARGDGRS